MEEDEKSNVCVVVSFAHSCRSASSQTTHEENVAELQIAVDDVLCVEIPAGAGAGESRIWFLSTTGCLQGKFNDTTRENAPEHHNVPHNGDELQHKILNFGLRQSLAPLHEFHQSLRTRTTLLQLLAWLAILRAERTIDTWFGQYSSMM